VSIPSDQNQIDGIRNAIVEFVVAHGDDLSDNLEITYFLAQREEYTKQLEVAQNRRRLFVEAKQKLEPLDRKMAGSQQALTKAEGNFSTLYESLGRAAFGAVSAGALPDQACFSERQALNRRIADLQAQHDDLVPAADAGVRQKLIAKSKQVIVIGKLKLEERKIRSTDTAVGRAIITSDLDDSVRCEATANLLDRVAHCRDDVSTCLTRLQQDEMARDNCRQDLCKTLSLAHIEGLQTLDSEMELCRRTVEEADAAMRQAALSLVESLGVADQAALPPALAGHLAQLKTIFQRELAAVSQPGEPGDVGENAFVTGTFPRPSLVLICWKCRTESLIAECCDNCGGPSWELSQAAEGGGGYFCTKCNRGYTLLDCPGCGQANSHVNFHYHKTLAEEKADLDNGCVWAAIVIFVVIAFVVALIIDLAG
jgi:hypothetical protein